jgi:hypothetical protein
MKYKNVPKAIEFIQEEINKMIDGKFDMNMFVISKTLSAYYKDPESIAHAVLAQRMAERDPGNKPASNERIPYVMIKIKEEAGMEYLQGDRIEHVNYVKQHNLKVDYEKYITNQVMKPVSQLFELIVEKLPGFPYGRGYYDEQENIWYNKYNGDLDKAKEKVKKLKAEMVQKLIFQELIDYANMKGMNSKTIDNWFEPINKNESNDELANELKDELIDETTNKKYNDRTQYESNDVSNDKSNVKKKEKPKHEIKIKKSKQTTLDKFFG